MPRYFFEIHNNGVMRDEEGQELPDVDAARDEAIKALPQIAADEIPRGTDWQHYAVIVTDESGLTVYTGTLTYTGVRT